MLLSYRSHFLAPLHPLAMETTRHMVIKFVVRYNRQNKQILKFIPMFQGPNYHYDWQVLDHYSGNDFGQEEARSGYNTDGGYTVLLPDGRKQIVTYKVADSESGYIADVRYEGEAELYELPENYVPFTVHNTNYAPNHAYHPTPAPYVAPKPTYKPAPYVAPKSAYKPTPTPYVAPKPTYKPTPAPYVAPKPTYTPTPYVPKPTYGPAPAPAPYVAPKPVYTPRPYLKPEPVRKYGFVPAKEEEKAVEVDPVVPAASEEASPVYVVGSHKEPKMQYPTNKLASSRTTVGDSLFYGDLGRISHDKKKADN